MSYHAGIAERYHHDGFAIVDQPQDVRVQIAAFKEECISWLAERTGHRSDLETFAEFIAKLAQTRRDDLSLLYKVARRFASARRIACDKALVEFAGQLMST